MSRMPGSSWKIPHVPSGPHDTTAEENERVGDDKRVFPVLSQGLMRGKTFRVPRGEKVQQIRHAPESGYTRRSPGHC
jgi:hypothetical protein